MSNYVKAVDFSAKDALASGNPNKIIKGTEINDEFNAIATAISSKTDAASPNFLGNPTAPTQVSGNNSTRLATTAFVQGELIAAQSDVGITGGTITGVAITGGTVSGLATDLAVTDGGTGASTITANSVILGNGSSSLNGNTVAPSTSGNVLVSNGTTWVSGPVNAIGGTQTWQNVSGSRGSGGVYTNSTGKPIMVSITSVQFVNNACDFSAYVNGVLIQRSRNQTNYTGVNMLSFIVPNGATYQVNSTAAIGIGTWYELR